MAADMYHPKPVDPLSYRMRLVIAVTCPPPCHHRRQGRLDEWVWRFNLDLSMKLYQFHARLKCSVCGRKEARLDFPQWR
ncbi:hypothetical protein EOD42_22650 [Rhodovarius crocodyli]|uniref:Uncharacterized protein n=1 Tax=Rhodovarius crocodyli TaxID=1979269 RepID=A0A437M172_9PROT|nr:hypothetical protein [Rhodovarius crocodyli]RVT91459.1 hypothetical protein EOD42_22650 [Rhodovarius crocodyli]